MVESDRTDSMFPIDRTWLAETISCVVPDEDGVWREKLVDDILAKIRKSSKTAATSEKPVFTIGPSQETPESAERIDATRSADSASSASPDNDNGKKTISNLARNLKAGTAAAYECASLNDRELLQLMNFGHLKQRDLEQKLDGDLLRAVSLRRLYLSETANISFQDLPFQQYDYSFVTGSCCENVVGYVPVPTGIVGPLLMNGRICFVPMSTTEGALIASTSRGCRAIFESGGVMAHVYKDGMTRAPVVQLPTAIKALEVKNLLDSSDYFKEIKEIFDSTSSYAKLQKLDAEVSGRLLFIRFEATTGDAMGMNMVSKGVNTVLTHLKMKCPEMEIISLSGNYCVDKKASAINWIKGRGKSVVAEATISATVVQTVLKTSVDALVRLAQAKLMIGSSMAATIGGWNAHAANIVAAIFIATGQDAAQVVSSSMCLTAMEKTEMGDLYVSCNMRCLEVGTVGGGTILPAQKACLKMLGCGTPTTVLGECAKRLAEIICSTVLAGELSLMAAQCSNDLVKSHIRLNRSTRCLSKPVDSAPSFRSESSTAAFDDSIEQKVKIDIALPKRSTTERPVKLEMHCSNIL